MQFYSASCRRRGPRGGASAVSLGAFTLVELLVVMAVIAILAALLFGVNQHVREQANETICVGRLRQWGAALALYEADHDLQIPRRGQGVQPLEEIDRPDDWFNCLPPYLGMLPYEQQCRQGNPARPGDSSVFVCPSATARAANGHPHFLCYGMNMYLSPWIRSEPHRLSQIPNPGQLVFMADGPGGWSSTVPSAGPYSVQARHGGRANLLFMDGRVEAFDGSYIGCGAGDPGRPDIRWPTLTSGTNLPFTP